MVKVAEKLIEAVYGWQEFVAVAEMVFAELPGRVSLRLQKFGDGWVFSRQSFFRPRQAHFQESGPQWTLSSDECGAARGAGLLSIIVGEYRALVCDAIDVWRAIPHHAAVVGTDVPVPDIVGHDDKNVGLLRLLGNGRRACGCRSCGQSNQPRPDFPCKAHHTLLVFQNWPKAVFNQAISFVDDLKGLRQQAEGSLACRDAAVPFGPAASPK